MKEVNCGVIRDLLPLYEDNAASEETQELVRRHLAECPDCRAELRKMRTPISLPPDEDEEALKRFLEYRAKVRRKQNVKIACVVSALAILIAFCLCYTLIPRGWEGVAKGAEPDRIMGSYHVFTVHDGIAGSDVWQIDEGHEIDPASINALMDALREGSYRAQLRNVLNYTPLAPIFQDTSVEGFGGSVFLYLVKDNEIVASIYFFDTHDHIVQIHIAENPNTFFYRTDGGLFDMLAALVKEYGAVQ